jgi:Fic family protein
VQALLGWLRENPEELTPIELAAVFHHRFVQIHPFTDGNERMSRLLMNAVLLRHGYPLRALAGCIWSNINSVSKFFSKSHCI